MGICPLDVLEGALPIASFRASAVQAYMAVWHEALADQPGGVSLTLRAAPETVELHSLALEPQLVIHDFCIRAAGHDGKEGRLVHGLLHIRKPSGKSMSVSTRERITREALCCLEEKADSGVFHPTVCILTGNVNLIEDVASSLTQRERGEPYLIKQWHTQSSAAGLTVDVAFVKGTSSVAFEIGIGASYSDCGMRKGCHGKRQGCHDFFGITLRIPLVQVSARKRQHEEQQGKKHRARNE